ncbi:hypothetical protein HDE_02060 [Halotydeus destructor]|nr:hypothetical protein HDE_02060 [Halotydeus destructor]
MLDKLDAVRLRLEEKCRHFDFEAVELAKVSQDDPYVNAFLVDNNGDTEETATAILKALVYRKKYQVYNVKDSDLPMEMFAWNSKVGRDMNGKMVVWTNAGCYRNMPELTDVSVMVDLKAYGGHFERHEKCDAYLDLTGVSFKSINTRLSRKLSSMVATCFPNIFDHMYICGLPVILTTMIKAMVKVLPERYSRRTSFITVEEAKARVSGLKSLLQPEGSNIRQVLLRQNVPEARIENLVETFESAKRMSDRVFHELGM